MTASADFPLPLVDGLELDEERRRAFRPGEVVAGPGGCEHRLPRWFYEVESWTRARETRLSEHFTLHELMTVDVREAAPVRRWPRYVPCAVSLLAAHLELLRLATGASVRIAANGGYRSPAHGLTEPWSTHCWGSAANLYRVGDDLLVSRERIVRVAELAARAAPALRCRPPSDGDAFADDHLHVEVGRACLAPGGCPP